MKNSNKQKKKNLSAGSKTTQAKQIRSIVVARTKRFSTRRTLKYRRQYPIGRFIVDFLLFGEEARDEVDGDKHFAPKANGLKNAARTAWLESRAARTK